MKQQKRGRAQRCLHRFSPSTAFLLWIVGLSVAYGEAWQLRPQVSLGVGADDNWGLNADDPRQVSAWRAAGDLALARLTPRMELAGLVRLDYVTYTGDNPPEDDSNQLYRFSGLFRDKSSRNTIRSSATLRRDTLNRTVQLAFDPGDVAVDPEADVDEALENENKTVIRYRFGFDAGWESRLTQRAGMGLQYRFSGVDYDNDENTGLSEFTDQMVMGNIFYNVNERNRLDIALRGRLYSRPGEQPQDDSRFETGELIVRLNHKFTQTIDATFAVGGARTNYETSAETGSNTGAIYRFSGNKLVGRTRYSVLLGQTRNPTGAGDVVDTQELRFNVTHKIGERTDISFRTRVFQYESLLADNPSVNRRFLAFTPSARWKITQWWYLDAAYRYRRQKRDRDRESAESNAILVSVVYAQPRILD